MTCPSQGSRLRGSLRLGDRRHKHMFLYSAVSRYEDSLIVVEQLKVTSEGTSAATSLGTQFSS